MKNIDNTDFKTHNKDEIHTNKLHKDTPQNKRGYY